MVGAYRDEEASLELVALIRRLDPGGAACRRLGPLDQDEVAQVLALYGSEPAAQAAAIAVLDASGGVPLVVHQAAGEWAQAEAAHQVEQAARQTASGRSHLGVVQSRLADDLADLRELREHTEQVARLAAAQEAEEPPAAAVCPYKGLARFEASDAEFFFGRERLIAELVSHLVGRAWSGWSAPRAAANPRWSGPGCCRRWPTAGSRAANAGASC